MEGFKGTPGPWIVDVRGGCVAVYQHGRQEDTNGCHRDDDRNIAYSNKGAEYDRVVGFWSMDKEAIHDFTLIAAAPELLEALQLFAGEEIMAQLNGSEFVEPTDDEEWVRFRFVAKDFRKAAAAIKKALGQ